jgi:hypothetical protein
MKGKRPKFYLYTVVNRPRILICSLNECRKYMFKGLFRSKKVKRLTVFTKKTLFMLFKYAVLVNERYNNI